MDMVGTAMVKNQVSSLSKTIGLSGDDKEEQPHDNQRKQEEEEKAAREKAKRDEGQLKKKAERAVERNKMREKYGLKESKTDQKLLEGRDELKKTEPTKEKGKDESSCLVM